MCHCQCFQFSYLLGAAFHQVLYFFSVLFNKQYLCGIKLFVPAFRKLCSWIKGGTIIIPYASQIRLHDLMEQIIHTVQYLMPASEILMKIDPLLFTLFQRIGFHLIHKKIRSCKTEPVNTLFYIPYHKDIFPS